ncbi:hypothetical protein CFC21_091455 [Triticum aestivum]|uniref:J domain-containing protein n=2 Tax=Triticum aestivum TaxID=4565 RepID=A0A3B6QAQ5_WHEAT|nr:chaperone protein dnaJ 72-like [Triticum aestivum]KAF7088334.1 hypothetical protein CFC21_091455 [Triticum aestivum]
MGDHYQTLGLGRDASKADIKNAFFRLAHRHHPDHHTHAAAAARAEAAVRFRQVKDAYDVLHDDRRRAEYDSCFRSSSSSRSSGYGHRHGHGHGGNSSWSSSARNDHGHRRGHGGATSSGSRAPPRPRGRSRIDNVIFCVFVGLSVLGEIGERWKEDPEKMERDLQMMRTAFLKTKQQWENLKRGWEKRNPWKSWRESREMDKEKN